MLYYLVALCVVLLICVFCGIYAYKRVSFGKDTGARKQLVNSDIPTGMIFESIELTNFKHPDTWKE